MRGKTRAGDDRPMGRRRGGGRPDPGHGQRMHEFLVGQRQTRRDRRVLVGGADWRRCPGSRAARPCTPAARRTPRRPYWNPFDLGNFATGTQGLVYEPLFLYDPVKNQYDPWLGQQRHAGAAAPTPSSVRNGVKWSDGTGAHRCRRGLLDQPGHDQQVRPVQLQRVDGEERDRERQHGDGHLQRPAWLQRMAGLPVEGAGRPAARLVQALGRRAGHRGQRQPGRHRPDAARHATTPPRSPTRTTRTGGPPASWA